MIENYDYKGNYDDRQWLSKIEKEAKGYGPLYLEFYKKREFLERVAISSKTTVQELNQLCINGNLEGVDKVLKQWVDGINQMSSHFGVSISPISFKEVTEMSNKGELK